jgi:hypothetical protein
MIYSEVIQWYEKLCSQKLSKSFSDKHPMQLNIFCLIDFSSQEIILSYRNQFRESTFKDFILGVKDFCLWNIDKYLFERGSWIIWGWKGVVKASNSTLEKILKFKWKIWWKVTILGWRIRKLRHTKIDFKTSYYCQTFCANIFTFMMYQKFSDPLLP